MNELKGVVLELPKISANIPSKKSVSGNVGAKTINIGEDGATFIPYVSADGVISWTNDKDLSNPEPVNIKGAKGDKGDKGDTPVKGKDYFTEDDKAEMVSSVIAALPVYKGEVESV